MCLAVPMNVVDVQPDGSGVVELEGVRRTVRLELLDEVTVGDIVIVHAGYAIEKLDEDEANARLELFDRLAKIYESELGTPVQLVAPPEDS